MLKKICIIAIGMFVMGTTYASNSVDVKARLKKAFPELNVDKVSNSPLAGFSQIESGAEIFYVSNDGKYLLAGNLINISTKDNVTENSKNGLRLKTLKSLPDNAFVNYMPKSGKAKYRVIVFTDIDCPYCQKLHQDMGEYLKNGIEISYAPFPRAGLGSPSYYKAVKVWCSKNPQAELDSAKLHQDKFKFGKDLCKNNPVPQALEVVRELHLQGTPAMILPNGAVYPGYVPADRLAAILKDSKNSVA